MTKKKSSEQRKNPHPSHKLQIKVIKKLINLASKQDSVHFVYRRILQPSWSLSIFFLRFFPESMSRRTVGTATEAIKVLVEKVTSNSTDAASLLGSIAQSYVPSEVRYEPMVKP